MKTIVKHISINKGMTVNELVNQMSNSGVFGAGRISKAVDIFESMAKDKNCMVFLGQAGAMVPGGMKNILIDMLKNKYIDVFVTTGATLTHDMAESIGYKHFRGLSDIDDSKLNKKKIVRIYDSFMPNEVYIGMENFFKEHFDELSKAKTTKEFLWLVGKLLPNNQSSILKTAYQNKIPIFCPALSDSGIGLMIWGQSLRKKGLNLNIFDDLNEIINLSWSSKKTGVIYIGGGVPKNYIQQAMQFSKSADYAIQISTDIPFFGGSSGADLREGISWGKLNKNAEYANVICDATIALPLIYAALKERI
ncbi:deoxyhypusine synthase [Candidatus Woesearchaeota archaeon]|nr:deoxyhypusine synthase [Candidatus Woesearchaeota archaeon]